MACDRLESLRDLYGYEFRETVLDSVIELLRRETRNCDYLGRLMNHRLAGDPAPHDARRRRGDRPAHPGRGSRAGSFQPEGARIQVTLSIGVSHYEDENTMFFDSLVQAAEGCAGRPRSRVAGDRFVYRDPGPTGG